MGKTRSSVSKSKSNNNAKLSRKLPLKPSKPINPLIAIIVIGLMIAVGYLFIKLSFAAGTGTTATGATKKLPTQHGCQGTTTYQYLSSYGVWCENGMTVNERPTTASGATKKPATLYGCQGITSYQYVTAYGVWCENGTTVNERPATGTKK